MKTSKTNIATAFRLIGVLICAETILRLRDSVCVEFRARCVVSAAQDIARLHDRECGMGGDDCAACSRVNRARLAIEQHAAILRAAAKSRGLLAPSLSEIQRAEDDERWMNADRARLSIREPVAA